MRVPGVGTLSSPSAGSQAWATGLFGGRGPGVRHGHQPARIVVHKTSNFTTGGTRPACPTASTFPSRWGRADRPSHRGAGLVRQLLLPIALGLVGSGRHGSVIGTPLAAPIGGIRLARTFGGVLGHH